MLAAATVAAAAAAAAAVDGDRSFASELASDADDAGAADEKTG